jgi:hypothetical protein
MSSRSLTIQSTDISSSQEWAMDPDMIEVYISQDFLAKAEKCVAFMRENDVLKCTIWRGFGHNVFQAV